jgi:hypothetical protein
MIKHLFRQIVTAHREVTIPSSLTCSRLFDSTWRAFTSLSSCTYDARNVMARATLEVGYSSDRTTSARQTPDQRAPFAQAVILGIALSLPVWALLIYCVTRLL